MTGESERIYVEILRELDGSMLELKKLNSGIENMTERVRQYNLSLELTYVDTISDKIN